MRSARRHINQPSELNRFFSAGASISAKSLRYGRLSEAIHDEQLGPEQIAAVFKLSACKTAKADVGGDFALVNDQATKFVAKHWLAISSLARGAEAA